MGINRKASRHRALADYGRAQSRAALALDAVAMDRGWSRILAVLVAIVAAILLWLSLPLPRAG